MSQTSSHFTVVNLNPAFSFFTLTMSDFTTVKRRNYKPSNNGNRSTSGNSSSGNAAQKNDNRSNNSNGGRFRGTSNQKPQEQIPKSKPLLKIPDRIPITINYEFRESLGATNIVADSSRSNHVLYIRTGDLTYSEIQQAVILLIDSASVVYKQITSESIVCSYQINQPRDREGNTYPLCYVWVSSEIIHNILTGRNPDGSERIEKIPDPDWKPDTTVVKSSSTVQVTTPKIAQDEVMSWGDYEDDVVEDQVDLQPQQAPLITRKLPPLMKRLYIEYGTKKDTPGSSIGTYFDADPSFSTGAGEDRQPNTLIAIKVPGWITTKMVYEAFAPYSTSKNLKYPTVSTNNNNNSNNHGGGDRKIFINFDPMTNDGLFALQMMKRCVFNGRNGETVIYFNHAKYYDGSS